MNIKKRFLIAAFAVFLLFHFLVKDNFSLKSFLGRSSTVHELTSLMKTESHSNETVEDTIALVVAVCGDRWKETIVLLKSALLLTKSSLKIYIFADVVLIDIFRKKLNKWQSVIKKDFKFEVLPVKFPDDEFKSNWRKLFKPCSSQRLFLPNLLENVDSILYVDTDTLFLGPLEQIWSHFKKMNASQFAALAPEHEDPSAGWYNRFARHPFYKPLGVNTGVMLMNLTRMRNFKWERYLQPVYNKYESTIPWGDQDIINIIFHFHPDKLYIYSCKYNYRADHCMYSSVCKDAERDGIVVLHGSRGIFHNDKYPPFQRVYKAMEEFSWGSDPYEDFYLKLERYLDAVEPSKCGKMKHIFLQNLKKYINVSKS